jgi:hypothetical protein
VTSDQIALLLDGMAIGVLAQTFCDSARAHLRLRAAEKAAKELQARLDAADARLDARESEK